jgi:hypothetical protein
MRQREVRVIGESRSEGRLHRADAVENRRRVCTFSGERFGQPCGVFSEGKGWSERRGAGAL